eukprot:s78_g40.t1
MFERSCRVSQQSRPALALLCEMPEVAVPPDLISFNAAINACEKASDWQAALEVFMATPQGLPNEITYNTTISACHKGSHWQGALDLFCSMELRALAPNVITHSATMASCLRGLILALKMLPCSHTEGNPILVGLMLQALGAAKAWEEAVAHIERLAKPGSGAIDTLCFTAAVRTCGSCGEWAWAMYLLDKMQGQGFLPDVVTATLVLSACRILASSTSAIWAMANCAWNLEGEDAVPGHRAEQFKHQDCSGGLFRGEPACSWPGTAQGAAVVSKESPLLRDSAECSRALTHLASAQEWEEALWITSHMLEHGLELSAGIQLRQVPQLAQLAVSSAPPKPRPQRPPPPVRQTEAVGNVEEQEETQTTPSMAVKAAEPDQQEEQRELSYRLTDSGAALIDLHGLPVEVAKIAVQVALEDLLLGPPTGKAPAKDGIKELGDFIIVTGVGNNSPGGIAVVRPAVIALLREELQIRVLETRTDGPGRLRVPASELRSWVGKRYV